MKENVLDVLMYLFENYETDDANAHEDHGMLGKELSQAGFGHGEIRKAFDWLEDLSQMCDAGESAPTVTRETSFRYFVGHETHRLDTEARGFLMALEQAGILDTLTREVVIDRILALETQEIDLDQVKWVTMMVLATWPGHDDLDNWTEGLVLNGIKAHLH